LPSDILEIKEHEFSTRTSEGKRIKKKEKIEVSERIHIYTHKQTWITGKAIHFSPFNQKSIMIVADEQIEGGTSGGPIVNNNGEIIGISSHGSVMPQSNPEYHGAIPRPHLTLPVWVCKQIFK